MTLQDLEKLRAADPETIDCSSLVQAENISINPSLPAEQRMMEYLDAVKNPYCFLCGNIPVKIYFAEDGPGLESKLKHYFLSLKQG